MKSTWRLKWRNIARKCVQIGLVARSNALTQRGEAISPSFGFGRFGQLQRRERLENEPHFLCSRSLHLAKALQTKSASLVGPDRNASAMQVGKT